MKHTIIADRTQQPLVAAVLYTEMVLYVNEATFRMNEVHLLRPLHALCQTVFMTV